MVVFLTKDCNSATIRWRVVGRDIVLRDISGNHPRHLAMAFAILISFAEMFT
jgi:hypothetical protein